MFQIQYLNSFYNIFFSLKQNHYLMSYNLSEVIEIKKSENEYIGIKILWPRVLGSKI